MEKRTRLDCYLVEYVCPVCEKGTVQYVFPDNPMEENHVDNKHICNNEKCKQECIIKDKKYPYKEYKQAEPVVIYSNDKPRKDETE